MPSAVTAPPETVRRKRGRPRKYGTPEQALAAKKTASSSGASPSSVQASSKKKDQSLSGGGGGGGVGSSSKKLQISGLGNAGQGFTPHIITVAAGEDVAQKIMLFMQQSKREICILSASGSISNASLRQPATSGGITYEGRFEIISLSGSYVRTELGGRTGGLSICLSSTDGQIVGGGVGGPLQAAGPVQVIIGTFVIDTKKDVSGGVMVEASAHQLPSHAGGASVGFRSAVDSSGRIPVGGNEDQTIGSSHFMIQPRAIHMAPSRQTDWTGAPNARTGGGYDLTGRTGHGGHQSPENGDY